MITSMKKSIKYICLFLMLVGINVSAWGSITTEESTPIAINGVYNASDGYATCTKDITFHTTHGGTNHYIAYTYSDDEMAYYYISSSDVTISDGYFTPSAERDVTINLTVYGSTNGTYDVTLTITAYEGAYPSLEIPVKVTITGACDPHDVVYDKTGKGETPSDTEACADAEVSFVPSASTGYAYSGATICEDDGETEITTLNSSTTTFDMYDQDIYVFLHYTAQNYTVTLKPNGGTGSDQTVSATYDASMPLKTTALGTPAISVPTRTGYNFYGYYDTSSSSGGTQYYTYSGTPKALGSARTWNKASNTNLYARWIAQDYTITLDKGDGGTTDGTAIVSYDGTSLDDIEDATNTTTGYHLEGYYTDDETPVKVLNANGTFAGTNITGYITSGKWSGTSDITLYAHWELNTHSIHWYKNDDDADDLTGSYTDDDDVAYGTAITAPNTPTWSGHVFEGWSTTSSGSTTTPVTTMPDNDVAYYAKWHAAVYDNYRFSCAEIEFTGEEDALVFVTSAAEKKVRSQEAFHVTGSGLTKGSALTFSFDEDATTNSKFVFKLADGSAPTTDANGEIDEDIYVYYTPAAGDTEDGLDEPSALKASMASGKKRIVSLSTETTLKGRHLPANFVIAAKNTSDGKWYALPADMNKGETNPSPVEIVVDNATKPTMVLTPNANVYTLYAQGNLPYVKLAMHGKDNAPLAGDNGSGSTSGIGKSLATNINNDQGTDYQWQFAQTQSSVSNPEDATYNMTVANGNSKFVRAWWNAGGGAKWGLYANGTEEIRLIPYVAEELEATVTGWTDDDMLIAASPSGKSATKVTTILGANSETASLANASADEHLLKTSLDFTNKGDEVMVLKWLNGNNSDTLVAASFITMPNIIAAGNNDEWSDFESAPTLSDIVVISQPMTIGEADAKTQEIVLDQDSKTGKLTINANKGLEVAGKVRVFDGSSFAATTANDLVLESSSAGNATLIFENDGNEATVQLYSKANVASASTWNWQYIGSPYNSVSALSYYGSYLKQWGNDVTPGWFNVANGATLDPWVGYSITNNTANETYVTNGTLVQTTSPVELNIPAKPSWIFANSWTAPIYIPAMADGFDEGTEKTVYLFNTGYNPSSISGADNDTEEARYAAGTYLSVPCASAVSISTPFIAPMQGFVVRNTTNPRKAIKLTLDYSTMVRPSSERDVVGGPMHAPKRNKAEEQKPVVLKLLVSGTNYDDCIYLLEREDFTTDFDNGWDGMKLGDVAVAPRMYTKRDDGTKEAVSAVPDLAGRMITFRAGEDSNYTFHFTYDENADALYLLDLNTNSYTRILTGNTYTFSTDDKAEHQRFLLTRYAPTVPTDIENGNDGNMKVVKFIENNHIYVIRQGRVYSIDGCLVK